MGADQLSLDLPLSLRERRKANGYSGAQIAREIGVDSSFISMIETGKRFPSEEVARLMEPYYGVKPPTKGAPARMLPLVVLMHRLEDLERRVLLLEGKH